MKKSIIALALTALASLASMAQSPGFRSAKETKIATPRLESQHAKSSAAAKSVAPVWTMISEHVSTTDLNGNTVSTSAILSSGKSMVVVYDATWNSWGWVMHQNGVLDSIAHQLGSQVQCIWVEADGSTDANSLYGGSSSQGNWTVSYGTSSPVPYPIIDNTVFSNLIGGMDAIAYYPMVIFVSPTGYWCEMYGTDWGFGPYDGQDAADAVQAMLTSYPQANHAPIGVSVEGPASAFVGNSVGYTVNYTSVDAVTNISWTCSGGTLTSSGSNATVTFTTSGNQTVIATVINTTGSTSDTLNVLVSDGFGDEMDYTDGGEFESGIGYNGNGDITWGVMFPASLVSGHNYLTQISAYINDGSTGQYDVRIYQGGTTAPTTLVYESSYDVTESDQWEDFPIPGGLQLDQTQSLWVTLHCNGISYPASVTSYCGNPNSNLIYYQDEWVSLHEVASSLEYSWMIKALTSPTAPPFDFTLNAPATGLAGSSLTFSVVGSSNATYSWTFQGGTPATATGTTVSASWATPGTYTVNVTGTLNGASVTKTHSVQIISCYVDNLPWTESFDGALDCWTIIDQDGDGYSWTTGYSGRTDNAIASASFINGNGALTPDNWLISPQVTLPNQNCTLEWYSGALDANYANDYYSVYISTTGSQPSNFTTVLWQGENDSASFTHHSVSLAAYAGQQVYIAFRHHNSTDIYWLLLDDVSIIGGDPINPGVSHTISIAHNGGYVVTDHGDDLLSASTSYTSFAGDSLGIMAVSFDDADLASLIGIPNDSRFLRHVYVDGTERPFSSLNSQTYVESGYTYTAYVFHIPFDTNHNVQLVFGPEVTFTVTALANDATLGSTLGGGSSFHEGDVATLMAFCQVGSQFAGWSNGATVNPLNITVTSDTTIFANFIPGTGGIVHDTLYIHDEFFIHDTLYVHDELFIHDTFYFYIHDTLRFYVHDTLYIHDTLHVHDTVYVGIDPVKVLDAKLYLTDGEIVVEGAEDATVVLYDAVGRALATRRSDYEAIRFAVPASGTYLVRIGNHPARRIVVVR